MNGASKLSAVYGESDVTAHVGCEFGERATGGSGEERGKAPSGITSLPPDISFCLIEVTVPIKCRQHMKRNSCENRSYRSNSML